MSDVRNWFDGQQKVSFDARNSIFMASKDYIHTYIEIQEAMKEKNTATTRLIQFNQFNGIFPQQRKYEEKKKAENGKKL